MYLATQTSTNTVKTFHSERKSAGVEKNAVGPRSLDLFHINSLQDFLNFM